MRNWINKKGTNYESKRIYEGGELRIKRNYERKPVYKIEDELHAEIQQGEFGTFEEALKELKRISTIPWNETPNLAPCTGWETCGRNYHIVKYDDSEIPWKLLEKVEMLNISAEGIEWKNIS